MTIQAKPSVFICHAARGAEERKRLGRLKSALARVAIVSAELDNKWGTPEDDYIQLRTREWVVVSCTPAMLECLRGRTAYRNGELASPMAPYLRLLAEDFPVADFRVVAVAGPGVPPESIPPYLRRNGVFGEPKLAAQFIAKEHAGDSAATAFARCCDREIAMEEEEQDEAAAENEMLAHLDTLTRHLGADHLIVAAHRDDLAARRIEAGDDDGAQAHLAEIRRIHAARYPSGGPIPPDFFETAEALLLCGRSEEALALLPVPALVPGFEEAAVHELPVLVRRMLIEVSLGKIGEARRLFHLSMDIASSAPGRLCPMPMLSFAEWHHFAGDLLESGEFAVAAEVADRALALAAGLPFHGQREPFALFHLLRGAAMACLGEDRESELSLYRFQSATVPKSTLIAALSHVHALANAVNSAVLASLGRKLAKFPQSDIGEEWKAEGLLALAAEAAHRDNPGEASFLAETAIRTASRDHGKAAPACAKLMRSAQQVLAAAGFPNEALDFANKLVAWAAKNARFTPDHAWALGDCAELCLETGDCRRGLTHVARALEAMAKGNAELAEDTALQARLMLLRGKCLLGLGEDKAAEKDLARAAELYEQSGPEYRQRAVEAMVARADAFAAAAEFIQEESLRRRILGIMASAPAQFPRRRLAEESYHHGVVLCRMDQWDLAAAAFEAADAAREADRYHDPHFVDELTGRWSIALMELGRLDDAERMARRNVEHAERNGRGNPTMRSGSYANYAIMLARLGRAEEAIANLRKSIRLEEPGGGGNPHWLALRCSKLGELLMESDRAAEAVEPFRKAAALLKRHCGPDHPELAHALHQLGFALLRAGKPKEGEKHARDAWRIHGAAYGKRHPAAIEDRRLLAGLLAEQGRAIDAERELRHAIDDIAAEGGREHPHIAEALTQLGDILFNAGDEESGIAAVRESLAMKERVLGSAAPPTIRARQQLAWMLAETGKAADALPFLEENARQATADEGNQALFQLSTELNLGGALSREGRYEEAKGHFLRVLEIAKGFGDSQELATAYAELGVLFEHMDDFREALEMHRQALLVEERVGGPAGPGMPTRLSSVAAALSVMEELEDAEPLLRRALALERQLSGTASLATAMRMNNLGSLLMRRDEMEEAEKLFRDAIAIVESGSGRSSPAIVGPLRNYARLLHETERFAECEEVLLRAIRIVENTSGSSDPELLRPLVYLADVRREAGDTKEEEAILRRALSVAEKSLAEPHPAFAEVCEALGRAMTLSDRTAEAVDLFRRALANHDSVGGGADAILGMRHSQLGVALAAEKDFREAQEHLEKALQLLEREIFDLEHPLLSETREALELARRMNGDGGGA